MFKRLFLIFSLLALSIFAVVEDVAAATSEVSKMRIRKITEIIRRYTNANEKLSDPYVQGAIFDEVDKELTLEPEEKANERSVKEVAKEVREKALKRFPNSIKTIKKRATADAGKKFKMAEKLDLVTIRVQRGKSSFIVSGIFYGHGIGGKSVRIGDHEPIAFFDLTQESRAMFDQAFNDREKKDYIDEKVRNYYRKKSNYTSILFSEIRSKIGSDNEALGYIYAWDKWRSPKNVTTYLIEQISAKAETTKVASKNDAEWEDDKPKTDDEKTPIDDFPAPTAESKPDSAKLRLAKLKRTVEERQLEIAGSQYGIDADQGFNKKGKRILWGMDQEDVNLIFQNEIKGVSNIETIAYEKGPYKEVRFHFINHLFFKVEVIYRVGPMEGMMMLWNNLNEKYGEAAESKQMREAENARQLRLKAIKNPCLPDPKTKKPTHKWHKKTGKCTKCKILKADLYPPQPPLEQTFTWGGAITKGVLKIRLNSSRTEFTEFYLSKEDTEIQGKQQALIDTEKKRKAEEEKQKRLEEYRKSLE